MKYLNIGENTVEHNSDSYLSSISKNVTTMWTATSFCWCGFFVSCDFLDFLQPFTTVTGNVIFSREIH